MKRIPENVIDDVRQKSDIVDTISSYLTLTRKGKNFWGVCPFHDDHDPSMSVSPEKQIYKCFVCGAGGNVFTFVQNIDSVSFTEAVIKQAQRVQIDLSEYQYDNSEPVDVSKSRLYEMMNTVQAFTQYTLNSTDGTLAQSILSERGFSSDLIKHFGIGVALDGNRIYNFLKAKGYQDDEMLNADLIRISDSVQDVFYNRLMFPISDQYGRTIAFSARTMDPNSTVKYINTSETELYTKGEHVYNLHNAKEPGRKNGFLIMCEGVTDVMAFYSAGYVNAVALLGVACTEVQMRLLRSVSRSVLLAFDGDKAGYEATYNIGSRLVNSGFDVKIWYNDTGKDPDEVIKSFGVKRVVEGIEHPLGWFDFVLVYAIGLYGINSFEDKRRVVKMMIGHLTGADKLTRSYYLKQLSEKTGFDESVISQLLSEEKKESAPVEKTYDIEMLRNNYQVSRAERELLKQMLLSKEAAYLYRDKLGFFPDARAYELALVLLDVYRVHERIELADIYSLDLSAELADFLSSIAEEKGINEYRPEVVNQNIDRIQTMMVDSNIKRIRNDIMNKSFQEQVELLNKATASKRRIKGGNKDE